MPKPRLAMACALVLVAWAASSSSSLAAGLPPDPTSNFAPSLSCAAPTPCPGEAVAALDQARARLGLPSYILPSNFSALTPAEQVFVLTNLDRVYYGLAPITGLTADLDAAAAAGVRADRDPAAGISSLAAVASNWASGYGDMALAYEAWMYADGPGGNNLDCVTRGAGGCWGHRHNILRPFAAGAPLAMGAAAGSGADGVPGYAMLLLEGTPAYHPVYVYTWSQAVAAGAGGGAFAGARAGRARPARSAWRIILLRVRGRSLILRLRNPAGIHISCALTRISGRSGPDNYRRCAGATTYRSLPVGTYRVQVRGGGRQLTRYVLVR